MKKSIFLALTAILALSFVACGKDKGGDTSSADSSSIEVSTPVEDSSEESSSEESSSEESSSEESSSEESSSEESSSEESSSEESSSEESSSEESSSEESSSEESSSEDSSSEESSSEESSSEESSSEESSSEESSSEESSSEDSSSEGSEVATAPVFSEIDTTVFEGLYAGDSVTIPTVTATDDTDGEVEVYASLGTMMFQNPIMMGEEIVFDMAGTYLLKYVAQDADGNVAETTITIVVAVPPTVSEGLAIALENDAPISGKLVYSSGDYVLEDISYEIADNYYYNYYVDSWGDTCKEWYVGYGDGKVLALQDMGYGVSKQYIDPVADMTKGYAFETVFDYTNTYYSVEEFVSAIYSLSEEKVESWDDGVFSFSLSYVNEYITRYDVSVSFELDDAVMTNVNIEIATFYPNTVNKLDAEGNPIPMLDGNGNPMLNWDGTPVYETEQVLNEGTEADSVISYVITQAINEDIVVEYVPEEVLVSSYTLTDAEGAEVSALDLVAGTQVTLTIADVPETSVVKYDTFNVTVADADGLEADYGSVDVSVNTYSNLIQVTGYAAGEYTITIESAFVTKTLTANVVLPETTEISAKTNKYAASLTSVNMYDDGALSFIVVANDYADASASVEITAAPDSSEAIVEEGNDGTWTFSPDYAGEYEITIVSLANEELTSTITITVSEAPAIEDVLNGQYQNVGKTKDDNLMVWFDWAANMILVTYDGEIYNYATWGFEAVQYVGMYSFTYDAATKAIAIESVTMTEDDIAAVAPGFVHNEDVLNSVKLHADYTMTVVYCNNMQATLETWAELPQAEPIEEVAGEYRMIVGTWGEEDYGRWVLGLNADGTGAFYNQIWNSNMYMWMTGDQLVEFSFTVADDYTITITGITYGEVEGFDMDTVNSSIAWQEGSVSFTFNGESCTFEIA